MLAEKPQYNYNPNSNNKKRELDKLEAKKKNRAKKKRRRLNAFKSLGLAIVFLLGSLFLLGRDSKLTSMRAELNKMERNLEKLEKDKLNLEAKLEGIKSSEEIATDAIVKLGMHYPKKDQIVYVSVEKDTPKKTKNNKGKKSFKDIFTNSKKALGGILGE